MEAANHVIKKCRACQAPIIFMKTKNDKWMPVDADSVDIENDGPMFEFDKHSSHFDTCENGAKFRKSKDEKKTEEKAEKKPEQQTVPF